MEKIKFFVKLISLIAVCMPWAYADNEALEVKVSQPDPLVRTDVNTDRMQGYDLESEYLAGEDDSDYEYENEND